MTVNETTNPTATPTATQGTSPAMPPQRIAAAVLIAAAVAALLLVCVILPAELHRDPLGVGKALGLMQLSAEKTVKADPQAVQSAANAVSYPDAFRTDEVTIKLAPGDDLNRGNELEWKLRMRRGEVMVYSWQVDAPAEEFYSDFHSQSDPAPQVTVVSHHEGIGSSGNGYMVAPFDGIHGWYLQNQSLKPVVVRLKISGFYTMRPDPFAPE